MRIDRYKEALTKFVDYLDSKGGLYTNMQGDAWTDLGEAYLLACELLDRGIKVQHHPNHPQSMTLGICEELKSRHQWLREVDIVWEVPIT